MVFDTIAKHIANVLENRVAQAKDKLILKKYFFMLTFDYPQPGTISGKAHGRYTQDHIYCPLLYHQPDGPQS